MALVDLRVESQTIGYLPVARIPQYKLSPANQHRNFVDLDLKLVEQVLNTLVAIEIDVRIWMSIAGEKLLDAQRSR